MSKQIIENRICSCCGGNEYYVSATKQRRKDGSIINNYTCINKQKEYAKNRVYTPEQKQRYNKKMMELYYENKEQFAKYAKTYAKTQKGKDALNRARQKERDNLTDNYVRQCIYTGIYNTTGDKIVRKNIPQGDIEKYRQIQIVKRKVRELNKLKRNGN